MADTRRQPYYVSNVSLDGEIMKMNETGEATEELI